MSYLDNISQNASVVNPREIIVMAYPKIGKTELCTMLPGSYVILDFEKGTDFFKCNKISINDVQVMSGVMKEFSEKKPHFDFIIFDPLYHTRKAIAEQAFSLCAVFIFRIPCALF